MRAVSNKIGLNIFYEKIKDSPKFLLISRDHFIPDWLKRYFNHILKLRHSAPNLESFINLLRLISVAVVIRNVLNMVILLHSVSFLSFFEKNSSLVGLNFGLCIYVSMYVCMYVSFYVLGYVTPIRLRLLYCPGK